jgi:hypothetical protein
MNALVQRLATICSLAFTPDSIPDCFACRQGATFANRVKESSRGIWTASKNDHLIYLLAGFFMFACAARADITHRYSFNDGTVNDSIGTVNGTLMNGAAVSGGQLTFDPLVNNGINTSATTGQYASLPGNILATRAFTLETWFTFNGGLPWQRILDFGNSVGGIGQGFIILTENGGYQPLGQISINSWGSPSDTDYVYGSTRFPVGGEHQLVYTHDTDAGVELLFLDGVPIGISAAHVDPATAVYSNFWLGRSQFAADPFFNGSIDELRTYNTALTAAQISADYAAGPNVLLVPEPASVWVILAGYGMFRMLRRRTGAS